MKIVYIILAVVVLLLGIFMTLIGVAGIFAGGSPKMEALNQVEGIIEDASVSKNKGRVTVVTFKVKGFERDFRCEHCGRKELGLVKKNIQTVFWTTADDYQLKKGKRMPIYIIKQGETDVLTLKSSQTKGWMLAIAFLIGGIFVTGAGWRMCQWAFD